MTAYFVAANGAQTGPFSLEEIRSQCSQGIIQRDTLMWRDGLADWQGAERVLHGTGVLFPGEARAPSGPSPLGGEAEHGYAVVSEPVLQFTVPAASLAVSRGLSWIGEGWRLFTAAPGMWIVAFLVWLGIQVVLGFIPVLGSLASLLLGPSLTVGLLAFAHQISSSGQADISSLFAGFKSKLGSLMVLALLYFVLLLVVMFVGGALLFSMVDSSVFAHVADPQQFMSTILAVGFLKFLLLLLFVFALMALVFSAYLYAPGLVYFGNLSASEAMKESFAACWRNWLPLLVWGLIGMVIILIAALPFGLGLLVVLPVMFGANYASFKDMFGQEE